MRFSKPIVHNCEDLEKIKTFVVSLILFSHICRDELIFLQLDI